jgi:hypothetical protein
MNPPPNVFSHPPHYVYLSENGGLTTWEYDEEEPAFRKWLRTLGVRKRQELYGLLLDSDYVARGIAWQSYNWSPYATDWPEKLVCMDWIEEHGGERDWIYALRT